MIEIYRSELLKKMPEFTEDDIRTLKELGMIEEVPVLARWISGTPNHPNAYKDMMYRVVEEVIA